MSRSYAATLTVLAALCAAVACGVSRSQPVSAPIGVATMEADGTIVLQLRAEGPGVRGEGLLRYPRGHAEYDEVLTHLGGLRPGETKPVPPWPEKD